MQRDEAETRRPQAAEIVRFDHADLGYRGRTVLRDVNLTLGAGQTLALVGPNGAGKSTLIRAILGLAQVLGGSVEVLGGPPARARGRAAYVPQLDTLDPDFPISAGRVVLMGRYRAARWWRPTSRADRRIAADALDRVGLAARARTRFGLLSGGQRQRVLVARALAARPRLLLLDEPFNGVDATSRAAVLRVLGELTGRSPDRGGDERDLTGRAPEWDGEERELTGPAPEWDGEERELTGPAPEWGGEERELTGPAPDWGGEERAGAAIVLSTHDLALARRAGDLVCLLNGRQFAVGAPDDVLTAERLREVYAGQAVDLPDGRTVVVET